MDLRTNHPRSVHERFLGVAMLARTIDKARAKAAGTLGDYDYPCPMDKAVLSFLELDPDVLLDLATTFPDDVELAQHLRPIIDRKAQAEIELWSAGFIDYIPKPGSDSAHRLLELRKRLAPERDDIVTWADVIDLEEGRTVPIRSPRAASVS